MTLNREFRGKLWRGIRKYNSKKLSEKIARSVLIVCAAISLSVAGIAKGDVENSKPIEGLFTQTNITLDLKSMNPLVIIKDKSEIVPGESLVQKEERIRLEAEAAALAERQRIEAEKARLETRSRGVRIYSDPADFAVIYQAAGERYGVSAKLLQAIHTVETGASGSTLRRNPSGATGPMQFLPSTFRRYGVDGNGDGVKDIGNVYDAIYAAANYLRACGYPDIDKALWGYNPSKPYNRKVTGIMNSL